MSKHNFLDTDIKELIQQYKQHDCLWNINSPDYKNIPLKRRAWSEIADYFQKHVSEVKLKIQYLRTAYVHQKRKVDASIIAGFGTPYKPSLFYYNELNFLNNMVIWRKFAKGENSTSDKCFESFQNSEEFEEEEFISIKNVDNDYLEEPQINYKIESCSEPELNVTPNYPINSLPQISKQSFPSRRGKRKVLSKINKSSAANTLLNHSSHNFKTKELYISFGRTIALQLQHLPLEQAILTMSEIHTLLTKKTLEHIHILQKGHESFSQSESESDDS